MPKFTKMAFFIDARWDYSLVADMSKAFLYLRKSYILISRFSSLLPWIILRSSVMSALRYSSNSLKSSSSSSNGHRELSTGLFKSEQFNQEVLTPGSRAQRSIYCSPGRAIWRDHSERMDEAAVRLHQHFRRDQNRYSEQKKHRRCGGPVAISVLGECRVSRGFGLGYGSAGDRGFGHLTHIKASPLHSSTHTTHKNCAIHKNRGCPP